VLLRTINVTIAWVTRHDLARDHDLNRTTEWIVNHCDPVDCDAVKWRDLLCSERSRLRRPLIIHVTVEDDVQGDSPRAGVLAAHYVSEVLKLHGLSIWNANGTVTSALRNCLATSAQPVHLEPRAAAALSIDQPVISRFVRRLEDELQVQLLHRHGRGVQVTEAGERLLEHGRAILRNLSQAQADVIALRGTPVGTVAIGMPPLFGDVLTIELMRLLRAQYPLIAIHIREGYAADTLAGSVLAPSMSGFCSTHRVSQR